MNFNHKSGISLFSSFYNVGRGDNVFDISVRKIFDVVIFQAPIYSKPKKPSNIYFSSSYIFEHEAYNTAENSFSSLSSLTFKNTGFDLIA